MLDEALYEAKMTELNREASMLQGQYQQLATMEQAEISTLERVKNIFLQANTARNVFLAADDSQKRSLLETLLWNVAIENKKVKSYKLKMPYELLLTEQKLNNLTGMQAMVDAVRNILLTSQEHLVVTRK